MRYIGEGSLIQNEIIHFCSSCSCQFLSVSSQFSDHSRYSADVISFLARQLTSILRLGWSISFEINGIVLCVVFGRWS